MERLAGEIGERNVFRPEALRAAADYIQEEWRGQGYQVIPHWYEVSGGQWANLEVNRLGSMRPNEILLVAPITTRCGGVRAPMTTAAVSPPCSSCRDYSLS